MAERTDVTLQRSPIRDTRFFWLLEMFHNRTERTRFTHYQDFIDRTLTGEDDGEDARPNTSKILKASMTPKALRDTALGSNAYQILKTATQVFLILESGLIPRSEFLKNADDDHEETHRAEPVPDPATGAISGRDEPIPVDDQRLEQPVTKADGDGTEEVDQITFEKVEENLVELLGEQSHNYIHTVLKNAFPGGMNSLLEYFKEGEGEDVAEQPPRPDEPFKDGTVLRSRGPTHLLPIELIWSYWHEEGMLVQTVNAVSLRFQNVKGAEDRDPLAELEVDPLRPLGNLFWGYIQDEQNRLSVRRRGYEYQHHYGLALLGKALPNMRPADVRSKFLLAWHSLLYEAWKFFEQDADTTKISDGFPLLNAAKEVHLILAQGAHNQFGDLPWTARVEMLMQQWLLARPEMKEFLRGRFMIPYTEGWMHAVDAMKRLKRWSDVTVQHYHDLAFFGERILLSLRYGNWNTFTDQDFARTWARFLRPEVQGYIHAYRAVTGVDLTRAERAGVDATLPAIHLRNRLQAQLATAR